MRLCGTKKIFLAMVCGLPLTLSANPYLLNDRFADGERATQSLPESAAWFATHSSATTAAIVDKGAGAYALGIGWLGTSDSTSRGAVAYFTENAGAKTVLMPPGDPSGSALQIRFVFTPTAAEISSSSHALRFIVTDSPGRLTADGLGSMAMKGYMISLDPGTGALSFRNRNANTGNYLSTMGNWDSMNNSQSLFALTGNMTYTLTLEMERLANGHVKLTAALTDGTTAASAVCVDSAFQTYSFDTVGFSVNPSAAGRTDFDQVQVSLLSPPMTLLLLSDAR